MESGQEHNRTPVKLVKDTAPEMDYIAYWNIICRWKKMVFLITVTITTLATIGMFFMKDIYESDAVIITNTQGGLSGALGAMTQQLGSIASLAGISLGGVSSSSEIVAYLSSNKLQEEIITKYDLLPVIFSDKWDSDKKEWEKPNIFRRALGWIRGLIEPAKPKKKASGGNPYAPTVQDGMREMDKIVSVTLDKRTDVITISVFLDDPDMAAKVANAVVDTLRERMSTTAREAADDNKEKLMTLSQATSNPTIRDSINTLLNQQIQTSLMAAVNENFAFKVIDPPMVPEKKVKPKRSLLFLASLFFSTFIGFFIAIIFDRHHRLKEAA